jgi:hypothetical protein
VLDQYVQTSIEANGSTSLTEFGGHYLLNNTAGTGPMLQNGGAAVTAGQSGGWAPIGAEQTAGGYQVAWKEAAIAVSRPDCVLIGTGELPSDLIPVSPDRAD